MKNTKPQMNITRRRFFGISAVSLAASSLTGFRPVLAQNAQAKPGIDLPRENGQYILAPLPYEADALEPHIDARTMEIHHGRHHAAYVKNLNGALEAEARLQKPALEEILARLENVPQTVRTTIRNNGGGHYNHALFWAILKPAGGGGAPPEPLARAIRQAFGGMEQFVTRFSQAALGQFGSGWAWLVRKEDGSLAVTSTPNQDNPLMHGLVEVTGAPILGLDVWEHAYYLNYQNRRADYVKAWWNIVDWDKATELFVAKK